MGERIGKKVALTGSFGVGKTTASYDVASALKKRGYNVGLLQEIARQCPFPLNEELTRSTQDWINYTQRVREIELINKYEIVVCDRSVFDIHSFTEQKFGRDPLMDELLERDRMAYLKLFLFPVSKFSEFLIADGVRSTDRKYQAKIEKTLLNIMNRLKVEHEVYTNAEAAANAIVDSWGR